MIGRVGRPIVWLVVLLVPAELWAIRCRILIVNSMGAMSAMPYGRALFGRTGSKFVGGDFDLRLGPEIPSDKVSEVIDAFFMREHQGRGMGLSIARTIVQAHRRRIWAENQPRRWRGIPPVHAAGATPG